jgi:YD repeat-containing protein
MRPSAKITANTLRVLTGTLIAALFVSLPPLGRAATVVYTYDALQRVTHVDYDNAKASIDYSYDGAGNRTGQTTQVVDTSAPSLTISAPAVGAVSSSDTITIFGSVTDANSGEGGVEDVMVNGEIADGGKTTGGKNAAWSLSVPLQQGTNVFTVVATDASYAGNQTAQQVSVDTDQDDDGLADSWELQYFGDLTTADATTDSDNDGLSDLKEYIQKTDPNKADTDGDGYSDYDEVTYRSDPLNATDTLDNHRPLTPTVNVPGGDIPVRGATFTADAFSDPDQSQTPHDYLGAAEWQIATAASFADVTLALDRTIIRDNTIDAATLGLSLVIVNGILNKGTQYWVRTRHRDSVGLWSGWSTAATFTTSAADPDDTDDNGVNDHYQVDGFADTNGDGVDDSQEGIVPIYDAEEGRTVGISADLGVIADVTAVPSSVVPLAQSPDQPLSYGLFGFRVQGLPVDTANPATVKVSFILPKSAGTVAKWYKYDPVTTTVTEVSDALRFSGGTAVLTITDGSAEDADGVVNGTIVDPSGPVFQSVTAAAPSRTPIVPGSKTITPGDTTSSGGSGLWLALIGLASGLIRLVRRAVATPPWTTRRGG